MTLNEQVIEEIRCLETQFAEQLAHNANQKELIAIYHKIKLLKEQHSIQCHSQLTAPPAPKQTTNDHNIHQKNCD